MFTKSGGESSSKGVINTRLEVRFGPRTIIKKSSYGVGERE